MSPSDWGTLFQTVGPAIAILMTGIWLFIKGKIHTDGEFGEMREQRDHYRDQVERLLNIQEETVPTIKEAVQNHTGSLRDMARVVDLARRQGLL